MELDAILDECLKFLKSKIIIFPEIRLYLFGSASTRSNKYNDIDILVIYQKSETLDAFIQEIKHFKFYPIIHLTCLTTNEDKELKFSSLQDAIGLP